MPAPAFGDKLGPVECQIAAERVASPSSVRSCENTRVHLDLRSGCHPGFDIALVADTSVSMKSHWTDERAHLLTFIDRLARSAEPAIRISLVSHSDPGSYTAQIEADLTGDAERLRRAVAGMEKPRNGRGDRLEEGIRVAHKVLIDGRSTRPDQARPIMILLSDGEARDGTEFVKRSSAAKNDGILVYALSYTPDGRRALHIAVTGPAYLFSASDSAVATIISQLLGLQLADLVLTESLPRAFDYLPGAPGPAPLYDRVSHSLSWHFVQPITTGISLTYTLQPNRPDPGQHTISGSGAYSDTLGYVGTFDLPTTEVALLGPCIPPSPTASVTPTSTRTPRPTSTPVPTATPTAAPAPLFLPLLQREACVPGTRRLDAVLVLDASSSMTERTRTGRPKLDAAVEAVRLFLDRLHLDQGDQAAIVAFHREAALLQPLTARREVLDRALEAVEVAEQTCLACGVAAADAELAGPRRQVANAPVMVLVTDGRSNPRPAAEAVERAREAKARGVVVFTIGLGEDLDLAALEEMASERGYFYRAPDAEDLAAIYAAIAVTIPCPADAFWGRR